MTEEEGKPPQDLTGTVVRGASLATGGYVAAQILNLGFYVVLARLLEPRDFGEFAAATVLIGFSLLITESGLSAAVIHRSDRLEEAAATAVVATVVSGTVFSLLALATAPLTGLFFDSDQVTALAAASAGTVFLRTIGVIPDALLQRRFSFLRRMVIEPAVVVTFGTAAVIAASNDMGPWSLVIGQYAGFAVDALLAWALVSWRPQMRLVSFGMWRELVAYGRHVFAATVLIHGGDQINTAVIGRLLGTVSLGQYRYATRLATTPLSALMAGPAYVLFPAFARIATDLPRLKAAFLRSLRWICVASFPAGLIFLPLGIPIAVTVFGSTWHAAGEAMMALSLIPAAAMLSVTASEVMKAIGRPNLLARVQIVTLVATVVAIIALQPFGLTAAAAGVTLGAIAGAVRALWLLAPEISVTAREMIAEIWPPATAALIAACALIPVELVVDADSYGTVVAILLLAAEALLGGIAYLILLRLLAPNTVATLTRSVFGLLKRDRDAAAATVDLEPDPEILDETLAP